MEADDRPSQRPDLPPPGNNSAARAVYFVSLATPEHQPWLAVPRTRDVFLSSLRAWHAQRNGRILAVCALPDVAHVLMEVGSLLTVGQVVSGWKAALRHGAGYAQTFRDDFSEYRVQEGEALEDYGLYLFLAPYRGRLIPATHAWDGWWLPDPSVFKFPASLNEAGGPPEEWVNWPASRFAKLAGGA